MSVKEFNINTAEIVTLTNKLEKLYKSDMPLAVRKTLNDAALDMKKYQIELQFDKQFTVRKKNFIRSHTWANKSKNTFDINQMVSSAGVLEGKSTPGNQLLQQEFGGTIPKRDYIPMKEARVSKSPKKVVSRNLYLQKIKPKIIKQKQKFIKTAFKIGKGGTIQYKKSVFRIKNIKKAGGKLSINTIRIYSFKKGRNIEIKKRRPFIGPAGNISASKIPKLFLKNAKFRIKKFYS